MANVCTKCESWNPGKCKEANCPARAKFFSQRIVNSSAKQDFFGKSPSVFVGRFGYPHVNVGFLSTDDFQDNDNPLRWSRENFAIDKIVELRTSLVNSNFKSNVKSFDERLVAMGQEVGMAKEPVDMEINLEKKPQLHISADQYSLPHGPSVKLKKARITENPKIPSAIEKVVGDSDLKAGAALHKLYSKDFDEHYLARLLSIGTLGVKSQRKLVPTRWSITTVDDSLGQKIIQDVKKNQVHEYAVFFGGFLGNYYIALFFPEVWSYELFETPLASFDDRKSLKFSSDYEPYGGRKSYAASTAGGYYAARLSVLDYLKLKKRQASVLLLRFITEEYYAPLGVWVVREAVRKALANKPIEFSSKEMMLSYAKGLANKKFCLNAGILLDKSILLNNQKAQTKLQSY